MVTVRRAGWDRIGVALAVASAIFVGCALLAEPRAAVASSRIVNGLTTHDYPSTGALLFSSASDAGSAGMVCSGTLIGCQTFLTAAHCVEDDTNPAHYFIFLQHAGVFSATSVTPHPSYTPSGFPIHDVAVIKLAAPVTGISPTAVNQSDPSSAIPAAGTIAGFGQTDGSAGDYGIKRFGLVQTASCQPSSGGTDAELVCWDYASPVGPAGTDSNTCNGDSGGPLFMDLGAGEVIAGVTSGGVQATCGPGDHSYDANVYAWRSFILAQLGSDSTAACGSIPPVGDSQTNTDGQDGSLGPTNGSDTLSFVVPANSNVLRVAMNAEDNGSLDANLYVRAGSPPTTSTFDCKADGTGPYGSCQFPFPAGGTWYALVDRAAGSGAYQLTETVFGGDPPVCGNGIAEIGEACDGADAAACPGLCLGDCSCPPPVCGNHVLENGEQCDGSSDAACPGQCLPPGDPLECRCQGCGNGTCDAGETAANCAVDCGCSAAASCGGQAPAGCYCDSDCLSFGDCCSDVCLACPICAPGCGNDVVEPGEQCDDANTAGGDCCSPSCQFEAAGTICDDGSACTGSEQCDGSGGCQGAVQVVTGCFVAAKSKVQLSDKTGATKDRFKWKWKGGDFFSLADLGTPDAQTNYELCVFDRSAGILSLAMSLKIPPSFDWQDRGAKGWLYRDHVGFEDGVRKIVLRPTDANRPVVEVVAKSPALPTPAAAGGGLFFSMDPLLTVQVANDAGACWTADYSVARRNLSDRFIAKSP